ncbi:MAG: 4-(cytidine 5'-diphospho)-2-C-methyl-D-erythritol kinase [Thermodesulfobacteriota bacterium]|nr:4-(cytidine 5'-diphospho)-2-C-methyl-D-erythritol kinase [Thermodesulfobacteriota bacterium]
MEILSPAKINLFLLVTGKRPDGYHTLFSLMAPVSLYDVLGVNFDCSGLSVTCDHPEVPSGESNLAFKAAALFFETARLEKQAAITIHKNIPVAAGLGGGSSNAAAVLNSLNIRFGNVFTTDQLMAMGAGLGADVPFFINSRPALATGIGETLELYDNLPQLPVLLIHPNISVSTAAVYKSLKFTLTKDKKISNILSFTKQTLFDAKAHLENDLEAVSVARHPEISEAKQRLLDSGATGVLMSGSGPTVFGLFSALRDAENAYHRLAGNAAPGEDIFLTTLLTDGIAAGKHGPS